MGPPDLSVSLSPSPALKALFILVSHNQSPMNSGDGFISLMPTSDAKVTATTGSVGDSSRVVHQGALSLEIVCVA